MALKTLKLDLSGHFLLLPRQLRHLSCHRNSPDRVCCGVYAHPEASIVIFDRVLVDGKPRSFAKPEEPVDAEAHFLTRVESHRATCGEPVPEGGARILAGFPVMGQTEKCSA